MAEYWKTEGEVSVLGTQFGQGDIPELRKRIGVVSSFISERIPESLSPEEIVLTGKYKSSILYTTYGEKGTPRSTVHVASHRCYFFDWAKIQDPLSRGKNRRFLSPVVSWKNPTFSSSTKPQVGSTYLLGKPSFS